MHENDIARKVVDVAYKIHTRLELGLLESAYEIVMAHEFKQQGIKFMRQHPIPIIYEGIYLEEGFRADFLVEDKVIVELKSIETVAPVHKKQVLTYLRLTNKHLGLLINFNTDLIKNRITRLVNNL